jgi:hypothetical protein
MLARPLLLPRPLGIDTVTARRVDWLVQMAGARDIALGAGALAARQNGGWRTFTAAALASDVADALVLTQAVRRRQIGRIVGGLTALSAVVAAAAGGYALATASDG